MYNTLKRSYVFRKNVRGLEFVKEYRVKALLPSGYRRPKKDIVIDYLDIGSSVFFGLWNPCGRPSVAGRPKEDFVIEDL